MSTLRASLEKYNQTLETLLSFIPAKYYLPQDDDDQQVCFTLSITLFTYTAPAG